MTIETRLPAALTLNGSELRQVPFIDQWLGHWAMRDIEFQAGFEALRGMNLSVHMKSKAAREAAKTRDADTASYTRDEAGVATIEIRGRMMKQTASFGQSAGTVALRKAVRAAAADPEVGAILLVADSPGGTCAGTAELAADVAAAAKTKPVIGLAEDMCCSACYWVLSQATTLLTQPAAMVGSIGTYGVIYDQSTAAAKEGVKVHVIRAGEMKGVGTPGTEVSAAHLTDIQREIDALNDLFVAGIAAGREMSLDAARELATGQVWIGQGAVDNGLADGVASIDQALATARAESAKNLKRKEGRKMAAATYQELVASCIGATPDFICEQLKAGASVDQSQKDWMAHQQLQIEASRKENEKVKADAKALVDAAEAKAKLPGNPPLIDKPATGTGGNAFEEFSAAVDAKVAKGMSRPRAVAATVSENPARHAAIVAEANAGRKTA